VAVVQYTYTHKQYRKRHKANNTKNTKVHRATQQLGRVLAVPRLCGVVGLEGAGENTQIPRLYIFFEI